MFTPLEAAAGESGESASIFHTGPTNLGMDSRYHVIFTLGSLAEDMKVKPRLDLHR